MRVERTTKGRNRNTSLYGFIGIVGACLFVAFQGNVLTKQLSQLSLASMVLCQDEKTATAPLSNATVQVGPKTKTWEDWPAVAYEEIGHPLVMKGDNFFNHARELFFDKEGDGEEKESLMDEFLKIYKDRPDKTNLCGIRINHALALYLGVKEIKPKLVVESGVNAGQSTYFIRAASSTTKIWAIDPLDEPICDQGERWIDPSDKTTYYTGEDFKDFDDFDWFGMITGGKVDARKTLIFLDDHLVSIHRLASMTKYGLRHVIIEDNYKLYEGATRMDQVGTPKQLFYWKNTLESGDWLFNNMITYAEFPPIVPPIMAKAYEGERKKAGGFMHASDTNTDIVRPILRPDINDDDMEKYIKMTSYLGIDPTCADIESYMQIMNYNQIAYVELLRLAPMVQKLWV